MLVAVMGSPWEQVPLLPGPMPCTPQEFCMPPATQNLPWDYSVQRKERPLPGSGFLHPSVNDHRHSGSS